MAEQEASTGMQSEIGGRLYASTPPSGAKPATTSSNFRRTRTRTPSFPEPGGARKASVTTSEDDQSSQSWGTETPTMDVGAVQRLSELEVLPSMCLVFTLFS